MVNSTDSLTNEVVNWLLEEDNPAVRAATLTGLMGAGADDSEVKQARAREIASGFSGEVLAAMQPGGYWGRPQDFYTRSKYHGTVWSFLLLSEMGCAFEDARFHAATDFLLQHAQRADSGGFTYAPSTPESGPRPAPLLCLTGNLVWAFTQAGFSSDRRVARAADWLSANMFLRDGRDDPSAVEIPAGMEKQLFASCWGEHTCMMGVVKALKALAAWPAKYRTAAREKAATTAVDFLLRHQLVFSSHSPQKISNMDFLNFGFPLLWRSDALEMLETLLLLGIKDEALKPALDIVLSKRMPDGRWLMDQSFNGRMLVRVEKVGRTGKWVTLRALRVLKMAGEAELIA
jgi:hypothetical protein